MAALPTVFDRWRRDIDATMQACVGDQPALLSRMMRYHMGWVESDGRPGPGAGGKALRPLLCLLAYTGTVPSTAATHAGIPIDPALPAAAAIELIHNFSLVHDDIQDQDTERHHRPTVWSVWGMPQAINAGDGLWSLATGALLGLTDRGIPAALVVRAQQLLNHACFTMIQGQSLDLAFEHEAVDAAQYLDMVSRKTGALIATALAIGALLGTGSAATAEAFADFGRQLGRVFQIQDDILGIWGEAQLTGKSTSSDIRRRKQSYPVVYTLSEGPPAARRALADVYALSNIDDQAVAHAIAALNEAGAYDHAAGLVEQAYQQAQAALTALPLRNDARADLGAVTEFLRTRQF